MKGTQVRLGSRSYEVLVGAGLLHSVSDLLSSEEGFEKTAILTDTNVGPLYADCLSKQFQGVGLVERLMVEPGETSKSWSVAGGLLEDLAARHLLRHDLLICLGGGMVSDLGGFVASTYLRGIRVVHVPTTLLGQVDAAIGGKTAVNLSGGKNLAGTFYQPSAVFCDVETLLTLPEAEFRSGLAEVIKYGLCFDPQILGFFGEEGGPSPAGGHSARPFPGGKAGFSDPSLLEDLVYRCAAIKAEVVSRDETDQSGRLMLNYGHTFGHALEAAGDFKKWSHGEAISVGMVFAAHLAAAMGLLDPGSVALHRRLFEKAGLPVKASFDPGEVARLWRMDKKRNAAQRWILLEGIGKPVIRSNVGEGDLEAALSAVQA